VAGVPGLEEVECLAAANLADYDPVRPQAHGRADKIAQRDSGAMRAKLCDIVCRAAQLPRILKDDDPVVCQRRLRQERIGEGRLARRGSARDNNIKPVFQRLAQSGAESGRQRARLDIGIERNRTSRRFADRKAGRFGNGRQYSFEPFA